MKLPIRPQTGKRIPKNWFRDLYDYIAAATSLRGDKKNIAVTMTDAGQVIRFIGDKSAPMGGAPSGSVFAYNGPFALYIEDNTIKMKAGYVFVNGDNGKYTGDMTASGYYNEGYIYLTATETYPNYTFNLVISLDPLPPNSVYGRTIGYYSRRTGLVQYVYSSYITFTWTTLL